MSSCPKNSTLEVFKTSVSKKKCHGSFALIGGSCAQSLSFGADWRSTENLDSAAYGPLSIGLFSVMRY
jgi:hypothetical protein